jgi:hypothetical protein
MKISLILLSVLFALLSIICIFQTSKVQKFIGALYPKEGILSWPGKLYSSEGYVRYVLAVMFWIMAIAIFVMAIKH